MILIFIGLILLCGLGIYMHQKDEWEMGWAITSIITGMVLFVALIMLPISYYNDMSKIKQYNSAEATIQEARTKNISDIERAALTTKIIDENQWLANEQYWNKTIFDLYIPNEVMKLQPLK